ncbi:uncharacterized protein LOC144349946 [Saccoglossus kowalevskii]
MAYRSSVHSSTGETPNLLMLGREVFLPVDLMFESNNPDARAQTDYVTDLKSKLQKAYAWAREQVAISARVQKKHYDRHLDKQGFQAGEFVWLKEERRRIGLSPKLQLNFEGPYLVIRLSDVVYRIQRSPRSRFKIFHYEKLKKYQGKSIVSWLKHVPMVSLDQRLQIGLPEENLLDAAAIVEEPVIDPKTGQMDETSTFIGNSW